jgi:hypothetical protein
MPRAYRRPWTDTSYRRRDWTGHRPVGDRLVAPAYDLDAHPHTACTRFSKVAR